MAESAAPDPAPKVDPVNPPVADQPNSNGTEPGEQPAQSEFDPAKLQDQDFEKIFSDNRLFKHPRFKSLSERARKADELEKAQADAEQKALAEQGKWKELAEKREQEAQNALQRIQELALKNAIQAEASKIGVVDVEAAAILMNRDNVKVNDDGSAEGVKEALEELISHRPYLKGSAPQSPVGTGSNPGNDAPQAKKFKLSQLQDSRFFLEHEKEIMLAMKQGQVEDDVYGSPSMSPYQL